MKEELKIYLTEMIESMERLGSFLKVIGPEKSKELEEVIKNDPDFAALRERLKKLDDLGL